MPFKKGQSGNQLGKPKGAVNRISQEMREVLRLVVEKEINSIPTLLAKIKKPETRLKILTELLPYVLPKLQSTEIIAQDASRSIPIIQIIKPKDT